jgi:hypothetical protein
MSDETGPPTGGGPHEGDPHAGGAPGGGAPSEEELRAAFEEQMRRIRVDDVLLQTAATLVNLGALRLGLTAGPGEDPSADRDLDQARLAIDAVRALLPLCPDEQAAPIREALSQLQMAYAREAQRGPPPGQPDAGASAPGTEPTAPAPGSDEAERAKARSKIWTPPGT